MANWWESAPVVEDTGIGGQEWWKSAPEVDAPAEQPKPRLGSRPQVPSPELNAAEGRIANAVGEGWRNTPDILTPAAREAVNSNEGPLGVLGGAMGRFVVNPLLDVAGAGLKGGAALGSGLSQVALEGANALGVPALGRDINMAAQVAPAAAMPGFTGYRMPTIEVKPNALAPKFIGEYYGEKIPGEGALRPPATLEAITDATRRATPETWRPVAPGEDMTPGRTYRANQQTGQREVLESGAPQSPATAPAETGGSVGAASAVNAPNMTPAEFRASRYDGELKRLMEGPQPGDATEYVPGVRPTKAEIELSPTVSREAKGLRQEFREGFNDKEKEDNRIYYDTFDELAGTKTQVQSLERARSAQADKDLKAAGLTADAERTPVNAQRVVDKIDEILADPRVGESEDVVRYLKPIRDQMFDADGKLKDDPLRLYGIREGIVKKLSKASKAETPTVGNVEGQLLDIRNVLDGVIEEGAPGYAKYRKNYSDASQVIDYKERLQDAKAELTNGPDRVFTFGKFDRLLKNLIEERGEDGLPQAAHHIPEDVMDKLYGIHKSLQRSASDQELAKTRGSDTTQMLGELGRQGLAQVGATMIAPGIGNLAIPFVSKQLHGMFAKRKVEQHLHPDLAPYRNRLMP